MKIFSRRSGMVIVAGLFALAVSPGLQAQVLEGPDIYELPTPTSSPAPFLGLPTSLDAGEVDSSVNSNAGALNDIVVMGSSNQDIEAGTSPASGRIWTLVHTDANQTRDLAVATPVDVVFNAADPNECYQFPSSVYIQDLDGDDTNDLAFMSTCQGIFGGLSNPNNVLGIQGNSSSPFQDANSLTQLGSQGPNAFAPIPFPPIFPFGGSQPILVNGDLNGDGLLDLAFYDFDDTVPTDQIHALFNDGILGLLPDQLSNVTGPVNPPTQSLGFFLSSGDFDGNGTVDVAVLYGTSTDAPPLLVYSGNGDGSFASTPMLQIDFGANPVFPLGLASGDFDGNAQADFVVGLVDPVAQEVALVSVLCSPGNSTCTTDAFFTSTTTSLESAPLTIVTGDFNTDGLDDIANVFGQIGLENGNFTVQVRVNNASSFNSTPDQTLTLDQSFNTSFITDLVAKDIDGCGGPDLAYTGISVEIPAGDGDGDGDGEVELSPIIAGTVPTDFSNQAAVAYNPNEAPVANAGTPTQVGGGIQVGGSTEQPTCSDPSDDVMAISWTVVSGNATFNDASASNPIVTSASANTVVQVTCTDACGLSDSATVTLPASNFIQGSCGTSLTGTMSAGFNATWLAIPALAGIMALIRRRS